MYSLQTTVTVEDKTYHIRKSGDFRMVLDCFQALNDQELSEDFRVLASLIIFYEEFESLADIGNIKKELLVELYRQMMLFINCGKETAPGYISDTPLVDWEADSDLICSAINTVAGKEIRAVEYIHWWTFMGYYLSVGDSVFSTVVSIRSKITKGKPLADWEKDFRRSNPEYFNWRKTEKTAEEKQFEQNLLENWKKGDH